MNKENSISCALCSQPIDATGIMATNPRTGKNAIMHQRCWKKEMDKKRETFQGDEESQNQGTGQ